MTPLFKLADGVSCPNEEKNKLDPKHSLLKILVLAKGFLFLFFNCSVLRGKNECSINLY